MLLETRLHWRRLAVAVVALPVLVGLASFAAAATPAGRLQTPLRASEAVVAALLLLRFSLRPFLAWRCGWLVVTDRRVGWRSGVFRRRGQDLPLHRVVEVTFEQGLLDRALRSGTLRVLPAGEGGPLVVPDVPAVRDVCRMLLEHAGPEGPW